MSADVEIMTRSSPWRKVRSVNQTSNGYVSKVPRNSSPFAAAGVTGDANTATGTSIIPLTNFGTGGMAQNGIQLLFYGTGSNNNTFSARVIGWSNIVTDRSARVTDDLALWVPVLLIEVQVTLSSSCPGVAGAAIAATELFADTITITGTTANPGVNVSVISPANDTIAHMFLDMEGSMQIELSFTTGGSATDCNALYKMF